MSELSGEALLEAFPGVAYVTDPDWRILALGRANWGRFARENGAPELDDPASVVGRNLMEFISGEEVQAVYRRMADELRKRPEAAIAIPIRCDGPGTRRELRFAMSAILQNGSLVGFLSSTTLIEAHERPPLNIYDRRAILAAYSSLAVLPLLQMCSFCLRLKPDAASQSWLEGEEYYRRGGDSRVRISHGLCPRCAEDCRRRIESPEFGSPGFAATF